eukprot:13653563-Alexandrium_andersonii.AAC.1
MLSEQYVEKVDDRTTAHTLWAEIYVGPDADAPHQQGRSCLDAEQPELPDASTGTAQELSLIHI